MTNKQLMTNKKLPSDYYPEDYKLKLPAWAKDISPIKDVRIIQLLLAALVITQVPAFWNQATKYKSFYHAMEACQTWEYARDMSKLRKCKGREGVDGVGVVVGTESETPDGWDRPKKAFHY